MSCPDKFVNVTAMAFPRIMRYDPNPPPAPVTRTVLYVQPLVAPATTATVSISMAASTLQYPPTVSSSLFKISAQKLYFSSTNWTTPQPVQFVYNSSFSWDASKINTVNYYVLSVMTDSYGTGPCFRPSTTPGRLMPYATGSLVRSTLNITVTPLLTTAKCIRAATPFDCWLADFWYLANPNP